MGEEMRPLEGLLVIDFSQFLSGPSASLRLADLGARVIKIERPDGGDLCRSLYISNLELDGDSTLFHSINRNKESFTADLKQQKDREQVRELLKHADVMLENFRPGVIEKLGFDYDSMTKINPRIICGEITGYGKVGPWKNKPGQDLLVQSLSGLPWLNGDADDFPVPFGIAIADLFAGAHLTQGILACLVRRGITGKGGKVEVSLMESILDFQFEVLTTYMNDGEKLPRRSEINNAHAYLGAPYGIYATSDGFISLAMGSVVRIGELLACKPLLEYSDTKALFDRRDEIKRILADHLKTNSTAHWLSILEPADVWCSDVFTWHTLFSHEAFRVLDMVQEVNRRDGVSMRTTRCPIRIDGKLLKSKRGAPRLGENTQQLVGEFHLADSKGSNEKS
ncbi:MAG TPA: CaiB/BaiF CoA-transferase family protein [Acidobacteriaceae bacterium]|jgi:crotonobetainyl-CoA:carnitine CoA-transferase CaiB-like acyl-CoA transferase|nr:CaiB/BaiF CoA-transferase family protein [Acidobacteriaceae bacterium]